MSNLALNKPILEDEVVRANTITDGIVSGYTGHKGFGHFKYPGTVTVDLQSNFKIKCIRILLWDGLGSGGSEPAPRRYRYRLAISSNNIDWEELYTSPHEGNIGWQIFNFTLEKNLRYIRVYGIDNTANAKFHIVEIEAFDSKPEEPDGYVDVREDIPEQSDLFPEQSETIIEEQTKIDSKKLREILDNLKDSPIKRSVVRDIEKRFDDLVVLDQNLESIRREIVRPVTTEIKKSNKLAYSALVLTVIGLIINLFFSQSFSEMVKMFLSLFN